MMGNAFDQKQLIMDIELEKAELKTKNKELMNDLQRWRNNFKLRGALGEFY